MSFHIGIDLGGTNIYAGVVSDDYRVLAVANRKTRLPRPSSEIVADIIGAARDAVLAAGLSLSDIHSAGIGSPGSVNLSTGIVEYSNNLEFYNLPLRGLLSDGLGLPAYIGNDANVSAYGEFLAGAGRGTKNFVAITLGTDCIRGITTARANSVTR